MLNDLERQCNDFIDFKRFRTTVQRFLSIDLEREYNDSYQFWSISNDSTTISSILNDLEQQPNAFFDFERFGTTVTILSILHDVER